VFPVYLHTLVQRLIGEADDPQGWRGEHGGSSLQSDSDPDLMRHLGRKPVKRESRQQAKDAPRDASGNDKELSMW